MCYYGSTSPSIPHFELGSGLWKNIPNVELQFAIDQRSRKARQVLAENDIPMPDKCRLQLIAMAAAEATILMFNAAVVEPSTEDLDRFFETFVLTAVSLGPSHAPSI